MMKIDKIRRCSVVAFTVAALLTVTACGAKKDTASNKVATNIEQSTETATVAKAKDMQMQVKDANGNTVTLTGEATINEAGEMVFKGKDSAGNVVKVTGTAEKTEDGSFRVKEAAVAGAAKVVADNGRETEVNNTGNNNTTGTPSIKPSDENNSGNTADSNAEVPAPGNKPESGNNSNSSDTTPATQEHTHTWNPVTSTVHHDATGHYEDVVVGTKTVVDKEAWDEPVKEWKAYAVKCLGCGKEFATGLEYQEHSMDRIDEGHDECGRSTVLYRSEQVDTIHHEAETHQENITETRWIEDTAAYDEIVTTGYTCSCGAAK